MTELVYEARRMPEASIRLRGVSCESGTPNIWSIGTRIRSDHRGALLRIHGAITARFRTTGASDDYVNAFYAASEMALMESVVREELPREDRVKLRRLWEDLLAAR